MKNATVALVFFAPIVCLAHPLADIDRDGIVNFDDFALFANQWLAGAAEDLGIAFESRFPSISITRSSIAYDSEFHQVAAHIGRFEDICVASRPEVQVFDDAARTAHAVDGDVVIVTEGSSVLSTTTDGSTFNTLVDIRTDTPFAYDYTSGDYINSVQVMPNGSWVLCMGSIRHTTGGFLYYSTDRGSNWVICANDADGTPFQFNAGVVNFFGWCGVAGSEAVVGEYLELALGVSASKFYYSDNFGASWTMIYDHGTTTGRHCHTCAWKPGDTNTFYAAFGDGIYSEVIKVQYNGSGGKKGPNWTEAANSPITDYSPVLLFTDGTSLYCGHDGCGYDPVLLKIDTTDDTTSVALNWPFWVDHEARPYTQAFRSQGDLYSIVKHKGVYYAAVRGKSANKNGGIYVSTDLKHWVCAYRVEGHEGFHNIVGYASGYLWGSYRGELRRRRELCRMTPVNASVVKAVRCEREITNILTAEMSNFEDGLGGWFGQGEDDIIVSHSLDAARCGHGSMKIVGHENEPVPKGLGRCFSPYFKPDLNEYLVGSMWIRCTSTWPQEYMSRVRFTSSEPSKLASQLSYFDPTIEWQRVVFWGKSLAASWDWDHGVRIEIYIDDCDQGRFGDAVLYVDCAQVVSSSDSHYYGSWQIGDTPRAAEAVHCPMTKLGSEFTAVFDWRPDCSSREWHGDICMATITDGSNFIDLYYDGSNSQFIATDGTSAAATTTAFTWEHLDSIKFALTNLSSNYRLSVQTPKDGIEHVLADGTTTFLGSPTGMSLGTNTGHAGNGCGLYANIRTFDRALSTAEISMQFDKP
jgi:hypothetical protein